MDISKTKIVIFSICLNEEETVGKLIDRIPKEIDGTDTVQVFIIDDGSKDKTAEIARSKGVEVYSNGAQKRLAYSFQKAIHIALEMGADIAVNIDGDLQYSPEEIPKLVKPIIDGEAEFVTATRFVSDGNEKSAKPENMPSANYYGNRLGTWVISKLSGKTFSDVTSGFRAYNKKVMMSININGKYTYTQEIFQLLAMKNFNIVQVPTSIKYYPGRKSRVVNTVSKFVTNSAINIIRSFRDFAPLTFFSLLGFVNFFIGLVMSLFMLIYYFLNGTFSPYKFIGFAGIFFISIGIFIWIIGLLADMLDRVLNNQEKILYLLKELRYNSKKEDE